MNSSFVFTIREQTNVGKSKSATFRVPIFSKFKVTGRQKNFKSVADKGWGTPAQAQAQAQAQALTNSDYKP